MVGGMPVIVLAYGTRMAVASSRESAAFRPPVHHNGTTPAWPGTQGVVPESKASRELEPVTTMSTVLQTDRPAQAEDRGEPRVSAVVRCLNEAQTVCASCSCTATTTRSSALIGVGTMNVVLVAMGLDFFRCAWGQHAPIGWIAHGS